MAGITVPNIDQATAFFKAAFDAKITYDGLSQNEAPRAGQLTAKQLGIQVSTKIVRQRMIVIGQEGPGIELFQMEADSQKQPVSLQDIGLNHLSIYVSNIETALQKALKAGGHALSGVHGNSKYEDSLGNGSVYIQAPWGTLIELQSIPNGHYYPEDSEAKVWTPGRN
ncbi:VOC family protein [Oenococcus sicerae]|uniref:VOC family protein n=1 Tax=Oenococcus sicerae TaxID=2203724 RepID=UPI002658D31A|nr:VOC family protein [Oenococcus sicerae]